MLRSTLVLIASLLLASPGHTDSAAEEIDYLIQQVANSGCTFTRNGVDHDAADAADHMRLKYRRGQRYADTAEHFIDRLASESSWTGKPYTITCDGVTQPSGRWLREALDRYRAR